MGVAFSGWSVFCCFRGLREKIKAHVNTQHAPKSVETCSQQGLASSNAMANKTAARSTSTCALPQPSIKQCAPNQAKKEAIGPLAGRDDKSRVRHALIEHGPAFTGQKVHAPSLRMHMQRVYTWVHTNSRLNAFQQEHGHGVSKG